MSSISLTSQVSSDAACHFFTFLEDVQIIAAKRVDRFFKHTSTLISQRPRTLDLTKQTQEGHNKKIIINFSSLTRIDSGKSHKCGHDMLLALRRHHKHVTYVRGNFAANAITYLNQIKFPKMTTLVSLVCQPRLEQIATSCQNLNVLNLTACDGNTQVGALGGKVPVMIGQMPHITTIYLCNFNLHIKKFIKALSCASDLTILDFDRITWLKGPQEELPAGEILCEGLALNVRRLRVMVFRRDLTIDVNAIICLKNSKELTHITVQITGVKNSDRVAIQKNISQIDLSIVESPLIEDGLD